jgi:hypothetical protein
MKINNLKMKFLKVIHVISQNILQIFLKISKHLMKNNMSKNLINYLNLPQ